MSKLVMTVVLAFRCWCI